MEYKDHFRASSFACPFQHQFAKETFSFRIFTETRPNPAGDFRFLSFPFDFLYGFFIWVESFLGSCSIFLLFSSLTIFFFFILFIIFLMNKSSKIAQPTWNPLSFGMEITNEMNSTSEQLPNCIFNPNWENSMDQSDPFESALSSIVSSPAASNATATIPGGSGAGDCHMIRELIGRLGSICNSGEISPESYIRNNAENNNNNNSTNNSCYGTPLNSPPKLNLSMIDPQIRLNLPIPRNNLPPSHPSLAPFSADPGFAERAARFSCFGPKNFGGVNGQFGLNENELPFRSMPGVVESAKLSRASSNQLPSLKVAGSQMGVQESNKSSPKFEGNSGPDKKSNRLSRSSTPENAEFGDSREGSSVSEQIPSGDLSVKGEADGNTRKRKSIPRGKAKETSSSAKAAKVNNLIML